MKLLDKIKKLFKKEEVVREETPVGPKIAAWENDYTFYESFEVYQNQQRFIIKTHFKPNETRKKEILKLLKQGFDRQLGVPHILYNVQFAFEIGIGHRGIPEENTLLLFLG